MPISLAFFVGRSLVTCDMPVAVSCKSRGTLFASHHLISFFIAHHLTHWHESKRFAVVHVGRKYLKFGLILKKVYIVISGLYLLCKIRYLLWRIDPVLVEGFILSFSKWRFPERTYQCWSHATVCLSGTCDFIWTLQLILGHFLCSTGRRFHAYLNISKPYYVNTAYFHASADIVATCHVLPSSKPMVNVFLVTHSQHYMKTFRWYGNHTGNLLGQIIFGATYMSTVFCL